MLKKKNQKEEAARINFEIVCLCILLAVPHMARAADFGAGLSSTSSGSIQKNYNLAFGVSDTLSIALYASDSTQESSSTTEDNKAQAYKGTFIYKPDSSLRFAISYKQIDDYYDFKGASYAAKMSVKSLVTPSRTLAWGATKFSIGMQNDKMKYSTNEKESYERLTLSLGLSQVLADFFTFGIDYSKNAFLPKGPSMVAAFKNKAITDTNISDTIDNFSDQSVGGYIEYNDLSFWSIGVGYSQSKNYLDKRDVSKSVDSYADVEVGDNITISPSYITTKSKSSSTPKTTTVAINLGISF